MGMLNRVCTGSSSPRLRYRMMHQKIRPQTPTPTISAAMTEAIHRSYILWACRLTPGPGHPKCPNLLPTSSIEQPERNVNSAAAPRPSTAARPTARGRVAELLAPTCLCLLSSAAVPETGHLAARLTDGRTLLDQIRATLHRGPDVKPCRQVPSTGRYRSPCGLHRRSAGL